MAEPLYSYGKLIGTRTRYNDRLLMFMLRNRAPERFGASMNGGSLKGLNAVGKLEKRRLKKKWRKEWEEERAAEAAKDDVTPAEVRASIARKVDALRAQVMAERADRTVQWRTLTRETRDAFRCYNELWARDTGKPLDLPEWAASEEDVAQALAAGADGAAEDGPEHSPERTLPLPGEEAPTRDHAAEAEALLAKQREEAEREAADERLAQQARESEWPRVRTLRDGRW